MAEASNSPKVSNPEVTPHVHEPAGPGEYCTACFDQGAVWAKHEERARVRRIIEGLPRIETIQWPGIVVPLDGLLAALDEGAGDA